jgi:hypothetical protein
MVAYSWENRVVDNQIQTQVRRLFQLLIHNFWLYLSHFWSNKSYPDYDALEEAAIHAWRKAVLDTELMKSVCAAPYIERANSD